MSRPRQPSGSRTLAQSVAAGLLGIAGVGGACNEGAESSEIESGSAGATEGSEASAGTSGDADTAPGGAGSGSGGASSGGANADGPTADDGPTTAGDDTAGGPGGDDDDAADATDDGDESDGGETSGAGESGDTSGGRIPGADTAVFVHARLGLNSNPGTPEAPVRTIQHAIELADTLALHEIRVAADTYEIDYTNDQVIRPLAGQSLLGGFDPADWTVRDAAVFVTTLQGDTDLIETSEDEPVHTVHVGHGDVLVQGFHIVSPNLNGPGDHCTAMIVDASDVVLDDNVIWARSCYWAIGLELNETDATLTGNQLDGAEASLSEPHESTGVRIRGGQPTLHHNVIRSGAAPVSRGVWIEDDSHVVVETNTIHAAPTGHTTGIYVVDSSPLLVGNTIGTAGESGYAIWFDGPTFTPAIPNGEPRLRNNSLVNAETAGFFASCIRKNHGDNIQELRNNNFSCSPLLRAGQPGGGTDNVYNLLGLEEHIPVAQDNAVVDASVVDAVAGDFTLVDGASCDLTRGGHSTFATGAIDFTGFERTDPWSIGAYEYDGPCL